MGKQLNVLLASPRGFCAGVERAIEIVERALDLYGPPVYVRHEIVHNKHVVESLREKGAIFVDEVDDTRTTLKWVVDYISDNATIGIFVVHNKKKTKVIEFDEKLHYIACEETDGNTWIDYPWDYI